MSDKEDKKPTNASTKRHSSTTQKYAKYSGLAIQMGLTIALFAYIGLWLDKHFTEGQLFTAMLSLVGVLIALYTVIKQLNMDKKPQ